MSAEVRLRQLQQLVLDPGFLGLEPLLDLLLGVHQELGASHLAQDKYVADFLRWGEYGQPGWVQGRGGSQGKDGLWRAAGLGVFCKGAEQSSGLHLKLPCGAPGPAGPPMARPVQAGVPQPPAISAPTLGPGSFLF